GLPGRGAGRCRAPRALGRGRRRAALRGRRRDRGDIRNPMTALDPAFLKVPLAHRGYHDREAGRPENSLASARASITAGYGIECDLQLSRDGRAMVCHDHVLDRLTEASGPLGADSAAELKALPLIGGVDSMPLLEELLA